MTSEAKIQLSDYGTDLSSRFIGVKVRRAVEGARDDVHVVDCSGVRTMSESFADELFGVLVLDYGTGWFRAHIRLEGASESVRVAILRAIDARMERTRTTGVQG